MKLKLTTEINAKRMGKTLHVYDRKTLQMVMGTTSAGNDAHLYNIKRMNKSWLVPLASVKNRILSIESKIKDDQQRLSLMKQIYRQL
jgi:hypothetical protein